MKIILLKSWWMNIGDGFVKNGAISCLKKAFPEAELIEASALSQNIKSRNNFSNKGVKYSNKWIKRKYDSLQKQDEKTNMISMLVPERKPRFSLFGG
jgi:hypothetical protein